jgi:hypothetical protein
MEMAGCFGWAKSIQNTPHLIVFSKYDIVKILSNQEVQHIDAVPPDWV